MDMFVAARFEPVHEAFEQDLGDGGSAFCAYLDGVPVVDLWGGRPGQPWAHDTRSAFAGFRFPPDVIVLAVRWYLRSPSVPAGGWTRPA